MGIEITLIIVFLLSLILAVAAYYMLLLTESGALVAIVVGYTVGALGGLDWLIVMVIFACAGLLATRLGLGRSKDEETSERNHLNVMGVGIPLVLIACLNGLDQYFLNGEYAFTLQIAFITALAVATADTLASEIGIKDRKVWMITTFERVKRGTNGGISALGLLVSLVSSIAISVIAWFILIDGGIGVEIAIPIALGFLGSLLDSLLGATLETRGAISKYTNNCISAIICSMIAILVLLI